MESQNRLDRQAIEERSIAEDAIRSIANSLPCPFVVEWP